ncbi:hypothetical protein RKD28_001236 [Streptomyces sp. SAI-229]
MAVVRRAPRNAPGAHRPSSPQGAATAAGASGPTGPCSPPPPAAGPRATDGRRGRGPERGGGRHASSVPGRTRPTPSATRAPPCRPARTGCGCSARRTGDPGSRRTHDVDVGFPPDRSTGRTRSLRHAEGDAHRHRALRARRAVEGRAVRRLVLHRRPDHRHLLPAELPGGPAQGREHGLPPERGGLPAGRVPGLQTLPARHQPRLTGVEPAGRRGGPRHAPDRRRRRRPRRRHRSRRPARLQHPAGRTPAPRRAGRGPPRARPRPARPDRAAPHRDHGTADGGDRLRGRLLLRPHLQRHRPRGLRTHPGRTARPGTEEHLPHHPRSAVVAPAVPGPAQPRQPLRPPRRHRRTRRGGVEGRRLPAHPAPAVRARRRGAHPAPRPHRLPPHPRRPPRPHRRHQPLPPPARPRRRPGRRRRAAARGPGPRAPRRQGTRPPRAAHGRRGRVRRPGRPRPAGLHGRRPHPRGPPGRRARHPRGRPRGRPHPPLSRPPGHWRSSTPRPSPCPAPAVQPS